MKNSTVASLVVCLSFGQHACADSGFASNFFNKVATFGDTFVAIIKTISQGKALLVLDQAEAMREQNLFKDVSILKEDVGLTLEDVKSADVFEKLKAMSLKKSEIRAQAIMIYGLIAVAGGGTGLLLLCKVGGLIGGISGLALAGAGVLAAYRAMQLYNN